ncbi:MAG: hypothetical protein ACQETL_12590 [Bacteroidota bacterium]
MNTSKITTLFYLFFFMLNISNAQNKEKKSKLEFSVESGLHLDINELLRPSYGPHNPRPPFIPDEFQNEKVREAWSNRIGVRYKLNDKLSLYGRIGYSTFKRTYSTSNVDFFMGFGDKKYVERYLPVDLLIERKFFLDKKKQFITFSIGPILRFYKDSYYSYGVTQDVNGDYYIKNISVSSRSFPDIGISYNIGYTKKLNQSLDIGINLNAYTLFYGYGLESIILAPFVNLKF